MKKVLCILFVLVLLSGCALAKDPAQMTGDDLSIYLMSLGIGQDYDTLSRPEQVAYVTSILDAEIMNGGLCQFFINAPELAPLVPEALSELGGNEHRALYEAFLEANAIDPTDLQEFDTLEIPEITKLYERYPWDDFDDAYCDLEPIPLMVEEYVHAHADQFR